MRQRTRKKIPQAIYDRCLRALKINYSRLEEDSQIRVRDFSLFYVMDDIGGRNLI